MIETGNNVIIIGGYQDCSYNWELNVVADDRLVKIIADSIHGDDIEYDDHENWLEKLPRFTFPATVHGTYQMWLG